MPMSLRSSVAKETLIQRSFKPLARSLKMKSCFQTRLLTINSLIRMLIRIAVEHFHITKAVRNRVVALLRLKSIVCGAATREISQETEQGGATIHQGITTIIITTEATGREKEERDQILKEYSSKIE